MNKHFKSLRNNIRKLRKVYHKRSDPNNWNKLQTAIKEYFDAYDQAKKSWWSDFYNKINCKDNKFWKVIDRVLNCNTKCIVQSLLRTDGSFEFDDENVTSIIGKAHITLLFINSAHSTVVIHST